MRVPTFVILACVVQYVSANIIADWDALDDKITSDLTETKEYKTNEIDVEDDGVYQRTILTKQYEGKGDVHGAHINKGEKLIKTFTIVMDEFGNETMVEKDVIIRKLPDQAPVNLSTPSSSSAAAAAASATSGGYRSRPRYTTSAASTAASSAQGRTGSGVTTGFVYRPGRGQISTTSTSATTTTSDGNEYYYGLYGRPDNKYGPFGSYYRPDSDGYDPQGGSTAAASTNGAGKPKGPASGYPYSYSGPGGYIGSYGQPDSDGYGPQDNSVAAAAAKSTDSRPNIASEEAQASAAAAAGKTALARAGSEGADALAGLGSEYGADGYFGPDGRPYFDGYGTQGGSGPGGYFGPDGSDGYGPQYSSTAVAAAASKESGPNIGSKKALASASAAAAAAAASTNYASRYPYSYPGPGGYIGSYGQPDSDGYGLQDNSVAAAAAKSTDSRPNIASEEALASAAAAAGKTALARAGSEGADALARLGSEYGADGYFGPDGRPYFDGYGTQGGSGPGGYFGPDGSDGYGPQDSSTAVAAASADGAGKPTGAASDGYSGATAAAAAVASADGAGNPTGPASGYPNGYSGSGGYFGPYGSDGYGPQDSLIASAAATTTDSGPIIVNEEPRASAAAAAGQTALARAGSGGADALAGLGSEYGADGYFGPYGRPYFDGYGTQGGSGPSGYFGPHGSDRYGPQENSVTVAAAASKESGPNIGSKKALASASAAAAAASTNYASRYPYSYSEPGGYIGSYRQPDSDGYGPQDNSVAAAAAASTDSRPNIGSKEAIASASAAAGKTALARAGSEGTDALAGLGSEYGADGYFGSDGRPYFDGYGTQGGSGPGGYFGPDGSDGYGPQYSSTAVAAAASKESGPNIGSKKALASASAAAAAAASTNYASRYPYSYSEPGGYIGSYRQPDSDGYGPQENSATAAAAASKESGPNIGSKKALASASAAAAAAAASTNYASRYPYSYPGPGGYIGSYGQPDSDGYGLQDNSVAAAAAKSTDSRPNIASEEALASAAAAAGKTALARAGSEGADALARLGSEYGADGYFGPDGRPYFDGYGTQGGSGPGGYFGPDGSDGYGPQDSSTAVAAASADGAGKPTGAASDGYSGATAAAAAVASADGAGNPTGPASGYPNGYSGSGGYFGPYGSDGYGPQDSLIASAAATTTDSGPIIVNEEPRASAAAAAGQTALARAGSGGADALAGLGSEYGADGYFGPYGRPYFDGYGTQGGSGPSGYFGPHGSDRYGPQENSVTVAAAASKESGPNIGSKKALASASAAAAAASTNYASRYPYSYSEPGGYIGSYRQPDSDGYGPQDNSVAAAAAASTDSRPNIGSKEAIASASAAAGKTALARAGSEGTDALAGLGSEYGADGYFGSDGRPYFDGYGTQGGSGPGGYFGPDGSDGYGPQYSSTAVAAAASKESGPNIGSKKALASASAAAAAAASTNYASRYPYSYSEPGGYIGSYRQPDSDGYGPQENSATAAAAASKESGPNIGSKKALASASAAAAAAAASTNYASRYPYSYPGPGGYIGSYGQPDSDGYGLQDNSVAAAAAKSTDSRPNIASEEALASAAAAAGKTALARAGSEGADALARLGSEYGADGYFGPDGRPYFDGYGTQGGSGPGGYFGPDGSDGYGPQDSSTAVAAASADGAGKPTGAASDGYSGATAAAAAVASADGAGNPTGPASGYPNGYSGSGGYFGPYGSDGYGPQDSLIASAAAKSTDSRPNIASEEALASAAAAAGKTALARAGSEGADALARLGSEYGADGYFGPYGRPYFDGYGTQGGSGPSGYFGPHGSDRYGPQENSVTVAAAASKESGPNIGSKKALASASAAAAAAASTNYASRYPYSYSEPGGHIGSYGQPDSDGYGPQDNSATAAAAASKESGPNIGSKEALASAAAAAGKTALARAGSEGADALAGLGSEYGAEGYFGPYGRPYFDGYGTQGGSGPGGYFGLHGSDRYGPQENSATTAAAASKESGPNIGSKKALASASAAAAAAASTNYASRYPYSYSEPGGYIGSYGQPDSDGYGPQDNSATAAAAASKKSGPNIGSKEALASAAAAAGKTALARAGSEGADALAGLGSEYGAEGYFRPYGRPYFDGYGTQGGSGPGGYFGPHGSDRYGPQENSATTATAASKESGPNIGSKKALASASAAAAAAASTNYASRYPYSYSEPGGYIGSYGQPDSDGYGPQDNSVAAAAATSTDSRPNIASEEALASAAAAAGKTALARAGSEGADALAGLGSEYGADGYFGPDGRPYFDGYGTQGGSGPGGYFGPDGSDGYGPQDSSTAVAAASADGAGKPTGAASDGYSGATAAAAAVASADGAGNPTGPASGYPNGYSGSGGYFGPYGSDGYGPQDSLIASAAATTTDSGPIIVNEEPRASAAAAAGQTALARAGSEGADALAGLGSEYGADGYFGPYGRPYFDGYGTQGGSGPSGYFGPHGSDRYGPQENSVTVAAAASKESGPNIGSKKALASASAAAAAAASTNYASRYPYSYSEPGGYIGSYGQPDSDGYGPQDNSATAAAAASKESGPNIGSKEALASAAAAAGKTALARAGSEGADALAGLGSEYGAEGYFGPYGRPYFDGYGTQGGSGPGGYFGLHGSDRYGPQENSATTAAAASKESGPNIGSKKALASASAAAAAAAASTNYASRYPYSYSEPGGYIGSYGQPDSDGYGPQDNSATAAAAASKKSGPNIGSKEALASAAAAAGKTALARAGSEGADALAGLSSEYGAEGYFGPYGRPYFDGYGTQGGSGPGGYFGPDGSDGYGPQDSSTAVAAASADGAGKPTGAASDGYSGATAAAAAVASADGAGNPTGPASGYPNGYSGSGGYFGPYGSDGYGPQDSLIASAAATTTDSGPIIVNEEPRASAAAAAGQTALARAGPEGADLAGLGSGGYFGLDGRPGSGGNGLQGGLGSGPSDGYYGYGSAAAAAAAAEASPEPGLCKRPRGPRICLITRRNLIVKLKEPCTAC